MTKQPTAAPGRPRSRDADKAILTAALRLLSEHGYGQMSIEGVAAEAGVGKTTIYRRYPGKIDLATAALSSLLMEAGPVPDSGDVLTDLIELLEQNRRIFATGSIFPMVGALLVEERRNPELIRLLRDRIFAVRRAQYMEVLERGVRCGDVRPDADLDAAIEALVGALYARHISGLPETPDWVRSVVDVVWRGVSTRNLDG